VLAFREHFVVEGVVNGSAVRDLRERARRREHDQSRAQAHAAALAPNLVSMRARIGGKAQRVRVCTRCLKAGKVTKVI